MTMKVYALRMDSAVLTRASELSQHPDLVHRLQRLGVGTVSRTHVLRHALMLGLEQLERECHATVPVEGLIHE